MTPIKIKAVKWCELTGHQGPVYALLAEGADLLSGGSDRMVVAWDQLPKNEGRMVVKASGVIYSLLSVPEKKLILAGNGEGGIHLISFSENREWRLLKYHTAPVFEMILIREMDLMVSVAGEGTVAFISSENFGLIKQFRISDSKVRSLIFHPEEKWLAAGSGEGKITFFQLPEFKITGQIQAHQPGFSVNAMMLSADQKTLITGGRDAHLNFFEIAQSFNRIESLPAHNYAIYSIVMNPGKNLFATASRDKTIKIWDAANYTVLKRISHQADESHSHSVNKLLWNGHLLFSCSDDRKIIAWQIAREG